MVRHIQFTLPAYARGYHIITDIVYDHIGKLPEQALFNLYIHHTSAGLTINEAADPDVLADFESFFNYIVPENMAFLTHTEEGPDDMPAHIKAALIGHSVQVPIINGRLALGTWQGIYLCEFRNQARPRTLTATIYA